MEKTFIRQWLQLSLVWMLIALVPVGRAYFYFAPPEADFYIVILIIGLLLCPVLLWWTHFLQRKKQSVGRIIFLHLFLSIIVSLFFHYATQESSTLPKRRISVEALKQMPIPQQARFHLLSGSSYTVFTSLMILSGLALLIDYNEQLRRKKNSEMQLQADLALSQIKVLQSELQPHFLFNTLHSVSSLMEVDISKAQVLIERLSFLLRNYLNIINRNFYSFDEEIKFLSEYIEVQQLRFSGKVEFIVRASSDSLAVQVPVVLLQPVIENSFKHGWVDRKNTMQIYLSAEVINNKIKIVVKDNGSVVTNSNSAGVGIRNLKERLGVLYRNEFSFFEEYNSGYCTTLILPYNHDEYTNVGCR